ncbi:MAG: cobyrinate a,c-diamide synthase [Cellvibrionaceae bacterium]|nr:cobyrinate a,c-diamide synthase [Cellvibrionaceae bacterium]
MNAAFCPALFLTAPASGQGKTTLTAALSRLLQRRGKDVRVFKTGPDYLDPQILSQASGNSVEPLDLWMAGEKYCQQALYKAAQQADLIIIEGAMGMFDGEPSSADLAARFNIPMVIVMDVKGAAQTAAVIAAGLANFRDDICVAGLIANNCGSQRHRQLIEEALPATIPLLATLKRSPELSLPERHLGLVQAAEVADDLERRFEAAADCLEQCAVISWLESLPAVGFEPVSLPPVPPLLQNKRIAVARDAAFSFIYAANLKLLQAMGAEPVFFSPLRDKRIPEADALWLPGGYPELHAKRLSENKAMLQAMQQFYSEQKPILAECGGFLYCLETLSDLQDKRYPMAALIPGDGAMRGKRGCQGMQAAPLPEGTLRAHAHHRSRAAGTPEPMAYGVRQRHPAPGEAIFRRGRLTASYLHLFFPSNPQAIAALFNAQTATINTTAPSEGADYPA